MTRDCLQADLSTLHLEEIDTHFRTTPWFKQLKNPELDELDLQTINLLQTAGEMSTNELSKSRIFSYPRKFLSATPRFD